MFPRLSRQTPSSGPIALPAQCGVAALITERQSINYCPGCPATFAASLPYSGTHQVAFAVCRAFAVEVALAMREFNVSFPPVSKGNDEVH